LQNTMSSFVGYNIEDKPEYFIKRKLVKLAYQQAGFNNSV